MSMLNSWCSRILILSLTTVTTVLILDCNLIFLPFNGLWLLLYTIALLFVTIWTTFIYIQKLLQVTTPFEYNFKSNKSVISIISVLKWIGLTNDSITENNISIKPQESVDSRIEALVNDIEEKFISKWYKHISVEETFSIESKILLEGVFRRVLQVSMQIDSSKLLCSTLVIFLKHLKEYNKAVKRSMKNGLSIENTYRYSHIGSKSDLALQHFIHRLTANVVREFISWELWNSLPCQVLVSVLAKRFTMNYLNHISQPGFINHTILSYLLPEKDQIQLNLHEYTYISLSNGMKSSELSTCEAQVKNVVETLTTFEIPQENIDKPDENDGTIQAESVIEKALSQITIQQTAPILQKAEKTINDVIQGSVQQSTLTPNSPLQNLLIEPALNVELTEMKRSEPVVIHSAKSCNKRWDESDITNISLGQDILALDPLDTSSLQNFSGRRLWGHTPHTDTLWDVTENWLKDQHEPEINHPKSTAVVTDNNGIYPKATKQQFNLETDNHSHTKNLDNQFKTYPKVTTPVSFNIEILQHVTSDTENQLKVHPKVTKLQHVVNSESQSKKDSNLEIQNQNNSSAVSFDHNTENQFKALHHPNNHFKTHPKVIGSASSTAKPMQQVMDYTENIDNQNDNKPLQHSCENQSKQTSAASFIQLTENQFKTPQNLDDPSKLHPKAVKHHSSENQIKSHPKATLVQQTENLLKNHPKVSKPQSVTSFENLETHSRHHPKSTILDSNSENQGRNNPKLILGAHPRHTSAVNFLQQNVTCVTSVSNATEKAIHKIGDLQEEAVGIAENIFDFGMAGIRKGLRLTGLQDTEGKPKSEHQPKIKFNRVPHVESPNGYGNEILLERSPISCSESPEYEETADLASTISKLRSLLQQKSESSINTPPTPYEVVGCITDGVVAGTGGKMLGSDANNSRTMQRFTKTVTGMFNTFKTSLPTMSSDHLTKTWQYISDPNHTDLSRTLNSLLIERRDYCTVDTAYEAVDSIDLFTNTPHSAFVTEFSAGSASFDELDELDSCAPISRVSIDTISEALSRTSSALCKETLVKLLMVLCGQITEDGLKEFGRHCLVDIGGVIGALPGKHSVAREMEVVAMDMQEFISDLEKGLPEWTGRLLGGDLKQALRLVMEAFQYARVNRDVGLQVFEMVAMQLVVASGSMSPTPSA